VGIDQPEQPIGIRKTGSPDAAAIGITAHVELRLALERTPDHRPIHKIARMMDLDAGIPFERRGGDIVVVPNAANGWIGVEARQDRVADHGEVSSLKYARLAARTSKNDR